MAPALERGLILDSRWPIGGNPVGLQANVMVISFSRPRKKPKTLYEKL